MSDPTKAVFLSYAREDTEAARRIADALRGFGVEVWFDQSELRGGDQWDAKIRGQIKNCALFIPVISTTTQTREEAYFRLEWKLADDRSHLMAPGKPFVVPVIIDDTPEAGAVVPDSFGRSQWTRLTGGEPSTAFIEQVKRLLDASRKPVLRPDLPRPPTLPPMLKQADLARKAAAAGSGAPALQKKPAVPGWVWGGLAAVLVIVAVGIFALRKPEATPVVTAAIKSASLSPSLSPPPPAAADKSIAVLPFANLSSEKENEFFADGVHDDVITNLAKIRDLKVISRTSVLAYRDPAARNLKKIAAELGVATILEGSIRRVGTKVHMNAQLIDARTDEHLWADTFDGDTSDIFALQASLAQKIAAALKATLTPGERALIERRPTENQEAYNLFLRGRLLEQRLNAGSARPEYDAVLALYEPAVALDPAFALAHVQLSIVHGQMYWFGRVDPSPERRARARAELEAAQRLAPDTPEIRYAQGSFTYLCENDWERALVEFRAAEASLPNDAQLQYRIGIALRRLGRWTEALQRFERSAALNPHDLSNASTLVETLILLRRYPQAYERARHYETVFPEASIVQGDLILSRFGMDNDRSAYLRARAAQPPALDDPQGLRRAYLRAMDAGDLAAADRLLADPRMPPLVNSGSAISQPLALTRAELALMRGDQAAARQHAGEALVAYRAGRWSPRQELLVRLGVARAQACSGLTEEVLRDLLAGLKELAQRDQMLWQAVQPEVARTLALVGRRDEALACVREMLAGPTVVVPADLRHDPGFASLKDDPRFEEIIRSAKPL